MIIITTLLLACPNSFSQELRATVMVNSDRIQATNKNVFTTLETAMNQFLNGQQWSSAAFAANERIECTFNFTVSEYENDNIKGELSIIARRPVYNSSYFTTILNWRDTNVQFEFMEGGVIEMQDTYISSNLVAVLAFYCNLILALDFDSFAPLGGSTFYRTAQTLATSAQSSGWPGWSAFDDNRSRTSIINCYSEETMKPYREMWYAYHRRGLDEMAANADRARTTILGALPVLKEIRHIRGAEIILQMFADCKLDEIVLIAGRATSEEKSQLYDMLRSLYPTYSSQIEPLKK